MCRYAIPAFHLHIISSPRVLISLLLILLVQATDSFIHWFPTTGAAIAATTTTVPKKGERTCAWSGTFWKDNHLTTTKKEHCCCRCCCCCSHPELWPTTRLLTIVSLREINIIQYIATALACVLWFLLQLGRFPTPPTTSTTTPVYPNNNHPQTKDDCIQ